jgi:hypothetical protein
MSLMIPSPSKRIKKIQKLITKPLPKVLQNDGANKVQKKRIWDFWLNFKKEDNKNQCTLENNAKESEPCKNCNGNMINNSNYHHPLLSYRTSTQYTSISPVMQQEASIPKQIGNDENIQDGNTSFSKEHVSGMFNGDCGDWALEMRAATKMEKQIVKCHHDKENQPNASYDLNHDIAKSLLLNTPTKIHTSDIEWFEKRQLNKHINYMGMNLRKKRRPRSMVVDSKELMAVPNVNNPLK